MFLSIATSAGFSTVRPRLIERPPWELLRDAVSRLTVGLVWGAVVVFIAALGHGDLLGHMSVFKDSQEIKGVTEFLGKIKGYLLSMVLAGFTIAAIGAGAAKFVGHSRANDLLFNLGVGVAIMAAVPTLAE